MKHVRNFTFALLFLLPGTHTSGADCQLEWRPLTPQQAAPLPGNTPSATLAAFPPSPIRREAKPVSQYPLYGCLQVGKQAPLLFRLDEARGSGTGYNRLILDFNRNADLTDDAEHTGTVSHTAASPYAETSLFGPVENPSEWKAGPWPAPFCFEVSLRKRTTWWGRLRGPVLIGQLGARPGWYLQITMALGNLREPLGVLDCDCNFKLGETAPVTIPRSLNRNVSFTPHDLLLRDFDRDGALGFNALCTESQLFARFICAGTNVLMLALDPNLRFVRLEPYAGPVGEVNLHGQLESALLAWWKDGTWIPVFVGLEQGKATVPAGTYCLHSCVLRGVDRNGQPILARGHNLTAASTFQVASGRTTSVRCGPPLELRVETRWFPTEVPRRATQGLGQLDINLRVVGVAGEVYGSYARGPNLMVKSPPPQFQVSGQSGQLLLSGQLEYG